jgi:hypothetical protein
MACVIACQDINVALECSPGCSQSWIGDGRCDDACNNEACWYDYGDCETTDNGEAPECSPSCNPDWIGDGGCDDECNNEACWYDYGDCEAKVNIEDIATCALDCQAKVSIEDIATCAMAAADIAAMEACSADLTACVIACQDINDAPECSPGCSQSWIGDGGCDATCYNEACSYDYGDCARETAPTRLPGYEEEMEKPECDASGVGSKAKPSSVPFKSDFTELFEVSVHISLETLAHCGRGGGEIERSKE